MNLRPPAYSQFSISVRFLFLQDNRHSRPFYCSTNFKRSGTLLPPSHNFVALSFFLSGCLFLFFFPPAPLISLCSQSLSSGLSFQSPYPMGPLAWSRPPFRVHSSSHSLYKQWRWHYYGLPAYTQCMDMRSVLWREIVIGAGRADRNMCPQMASVWVRTSWQFHRQFALLMEAKCAKWEKKHGVANLVRPRKVLRRGRKIIL